MARNAFIQQRRTERRPAPQCLTRLLEFIVMFQLRWKKEKAGVYHDGLLIGTTVYKDAVLQYRTVENPLEIGLQEPIWSEWEDVPTEWIET